MGSVQSGETPAPAPLSVNICRGGLAVPSSLESGAPDRETLACSPSDGLGDRHPSCSSPYRRRKSQPSHSSSHNQPPSGISSYQAEVCFHCAFPTRLTHIRDEELII